MRGELKGVDMGIVNAVYLKLVKFLILNYVN